MLLEQAPHLWYTRQVRTILQKLAAAAADPQERSITLSQREASYISAALEWAADQLDELQDEDTVGGNAILAGLEQAADDE